MTKELTILLIIMFLCLSAAIYGFILNQACEDSISEALKGKASALVCGKAFIISYTGSEGRQTYFIHARPLTMKGEF